MSRIGPFLKSRIAVTAALAGLLTGPAGAHLIPAPCDFITGGGFIFKDDLARANFGAHGGCKKNGPDAPFWGHVNYVDHGGVLGTGPYHVNSTQITGYLFDPAFPRARDICGFARTNKGETVRFRVRMEDNGEPGVNDRFGIRLSNGYLVTPRRLANGGPGGGNIQLHKPNPSTPSPCPADQPNCTTEFEICGDLRTPEEGPPPDGTPPTVRITSPAPGSTVSGGITVSADASDDMGVAGVRFRLDGADLGMEDGTAPYSVEWDTTTATDGSHDLTAVARDGAGNMATSDPVTVTVANGAPPPGGGDIFVSLRDGHVRRFHPDGTLMQVLTSVSDGPANGMAFDRERNLYVTHWFGLTTPGNTVARFDPDGNLLGTFGSGYNSNPESIVFDANGNAYVGQADDTQDILMFAPSGELLAAFDVAVEHRGSDWIELAPNQCTILYTSRDRNVLRFDACTRTQLPNFNAQPLPGPNAFALRVLPDGGVLVADGSVIVRLDGSGGLVRTYDVAGEPDGWIGLDLAGDGTFWASNFSSSNVYRFDVDSGAVVVSFNTGTPGSTVDAVAVRR